MGHRWARASRLWGMGSSPRDFRVFHHLRDGVVAEEIAVVPALAMAGGWIMREKKSGFQPQKRAEWKCSKFQVLAVSLQITEEWALTRGDRGSSSIPHGWWSLWLQVRGSGWPGSGALAGGGGGGRICREHTGNAPEASLGDTPCPFPQPPKQNRINWNDPSPPRKRLLPA